MNHLNSFISGLFTVLILSAGVQAAEISRQQLDAPDVFVSTCGGLAHGENVAPGDLINYPFDHVCNSTSSLATSLGSPLSQHVSYVAPYVDAQAQGQATYGWGSAAVTFSGNNNLNFPAATATMGWEDQMLLSTPGLAGQVGLLKAWIKVEGHLEAAPSANGGTRFTVRGYGSTSGPGNLPVQASWGGQGQQFSPYNESIDALVPIYIAFKWNEPFEMGLFGQLRIGAASMGFQTPAPGQPLSAGSGDISRMSWEGISDFYYTHHNGFFTEVLPVNASLVTMSSDTGINWMNAVAAPVPEPAVGWLVAAGLGLVLVRCYRKDCTLGNNRV